MRQNVNKALRKPRSAPNSTYSHYDPKKCREVGKSLENQKSKENHRNGSLKEREKPKVNLKNREREHGKSNENGKCNENGKLKKNLRDERFKEKKTSKENLRSERFKDSKKCNDNRKSEENVHQGNRQLKEKRRLKDYGKSYQNGESSSKTRSSSVQTANPSDSEETDEEINCPKCRKSSKYNSNKKDTSSDDSDDEDLKRRCKTLKKRSRSGSDGEEGRLRKNRHRLKRSLSEFEMLPRHSHQVKQRRKERDTGTQCNRPNNSSHDLEEIIKPNWSGRLKRRKYEQYRKKYVWARKCKKFHGRNSSTSSG